MVIKKKSHGIEEEQYSAIMCDYSLLIVQKGVWWLSCRMFSCILNQFGKDIFKLLEPRSEKVGEI